MLYGNLRWVDIEKLDKKRLVVVCPTASLEQHGHHLPLLTDTYLVTGIAERVHAILGDRILLTPTLWLGTSDHHLDFPGTLSVPLSLYAEVIKSLVRCFARAGFRRVFFLNGHGGNAAPGACAICEAANEWDECDRMQIAFANYWRIAKPVMDAEALGMASPFISHSCEYETSMMLHFRKELVVMGKAKGGPPVINTPFYHSELLGRVDVAGRFHRLSRTGAMGRPEEATAEKGEALVAAIAGEVAAFLRDFASWKELPVLKPRKKARRS